MIQTIQVQGTEKRLYQLIAPLVMNPDVLSANNNYPFKTTEHYVWFIAVDKKSVVGFMPVERRRSGCVINNYYVCEDNRETLSLLITTTLEAIGSEVRLCAVVMVEHQAVFEKHGFIVDKAWKRYVKMQKDE